MANPFVPVAITQHDANKYGCPYCGFHRARQTNYGNISIYYCSECQRAYAVFPFFVRSTTAKIGDYTPVLFPHPRKGILAHTRRPDQPQSGGEYFTISDFRTSDARCFVCGCQQPDEETMVGSVRSQEAGKNVLSLFDQYAHLMLSPTTAPSVFVSACSNHSKNLARLSKLIRLRDNTITPAMVRLAKEKTNNSGEHLTPLHLQRYKKGNLVITDIADSYRIEGKIVTFRFERNLLYFVLTRVQRRLPSGQWKKIPARIYPAVPLQMQFEETASQLVCDMPLVGERIILTPL